LKGGSSERKFEFCCVDCQFFQEWIKLRQQEKRNLLFSRKSKVGIIIKKDRDLSDPFPRSIDLCPFFNWEGNNSLFMGNLRELLINILIIQEIEKRRFYGLLICF